MEFLRRLFGVHCPGCTCFKQVLPRAEHTLPQADEFGPLPKANAPDLQSPPHTHDWGPWEIVKEGTITEDDGRETGTYLDQKRRCKTCGKHEIDTQVASINTDEDESE